MSNSLDKEVNAGFLLKFSLPTMLSMLIMSTFGIVDGVFVSRLIDDMALAAVNLSVPFLTFALAIGFMLGVGGNALTAKKIGEGDLEEARRIFSLISLVSFGVSVVMSSFGLFFPDLLLEILGADAFMAPFVMDYIMPVIWFLPIIVMSVIFQQFLMTEGKAHISTIAFLIGGGVGVFLNWFLIGEQGLGLQGAAIATGVGYSISAAVGFVFFLFNKKGKLYFVRPKFSLPVLGQSSINGSSEFVTMMSVSVLSTFMNNILMDVEGPLAVAAVGISFAAMGILSSLFIGYASGIMPIISFNYGKEDSQRLKALFKNSVFIVGGLALVTTVIAWFVAPLLVMIYVPRGSQVYYMAVEAFRIIALGFVFMGFSSFGSMMFTGLNNGLVSSVISFCRTLLFAVIALMVLPEMFGLTGAYFAIPVAEVLGLVVTAGLLIALRKKYQYV